MNLIQQLLSSTALIIIANTATAETFTDTFDGQPNAPEIFTDDNWDVALHTRDRTSWYEVNAGNVAAHGADCSPPPATHPLQFIEETVFLCKDHLMTAVNDDGFGVATLTPNHMLDLSSGTATVSFDISTFRSGGYDWIELVLTPFEDNLVHPAADFWQVAGPPDNAIQIAMTPGTDNTFTLTLHRDGVASVYQFCDRCEGVNFWTSYGSPELPLIPDQRRRETFELTLTNDGKLSFGVVNYFDGDTTDRSFYWLDNVDVSPLDWESAVVQLQHFSFNPTNNCGDTSCDGDTWHWDNVTIDPALPFTIIPSLNRTVDPLVSPNTTMSFASPSEQNSYLRFSAIGKDVEISIDQGQSWQAATLQRPIEAEESMDGRFRNYFHPLEAGVSNVQFRAKDWWGGSWHVRDASIWER